MFYKSKMLQTINPQLKRVIYFLFKGRKPAFFIKKGRHYLRKDNPKMAERFLQLGLDIHPGNWRIHEAFALYLNEKKQWKRAIRHWTAVYKVRKNKLSPQSTLQYARALKHVKKPNEAIEILTVSLKKHPTNKRIIIKLTNLLIGRKLWRKAADVFITLFELESKVHSATSYGKMAKIYMELALFDRAQYIIVRGMEHYPTDEQLLDYYVDIPIYKKDWDFAIERIEQLLANEHILVPMNSQVKLSMLYQIKGHNRKAEKIFSDVLENFKQQIERDKKGYCEITLFHNGESQIIFFKNLKKVNQVVVTFDTIFMDWNEPSFGFNFILRQQSDIIAVRKRNKGESQQHLTQEEFIEATQLIVDGYEDKVAYGYSLGGYTSLYYASKLNCRILALAPRISLHPVHGKEGQGEKQEFTHRLSQDFNDEIAPIIVYDPRDKLDNAYVQNELRVAFPRAEFIEIHYGGHGIGRHLMRMGSLKDFLLTVLNGGIPTYDRSLKSKSANYCRLLGRECLRRNKLKWASDLSERAIQLLPNDRHGIKFRIDVLRKFDKIDEAIVYASERMRKLPNSIHLRLYLIDLYIEKGELIYAEKEVKSAQVKFKNRIELAQQMERINQMWA